MGLEAASYISGLVTTNPVGGTDPKSQGDDHIRLIKSVLKASFPNISGAVTLSHTEINNAYPKSGGAISGNMTISGTLGVSGTTSVAALTASGTITANGALTVAGGALTMTSRPIRFANAVSSLGTTTWDPSSTANFGNIYQLTGSSNITGINSGAPKIMAILFASSRNLIHSANLLLPGQADIVTAENDRAIFFQVDASSNVWTCIYQRSATAP